VTFSLRHGSTSISYFSSAGPHHNLFQEDQVHAFYEGLNDPNKSLVDSACGDVLLKKNSEEAIELFETLSKNSQQLSS
jgi:hypothetical protein